MIIPTPLTLGAIGGAILLSLILTSCSSAPTVVIRPDGSRTINLGASLFEDSKSELAQVRMPDGTTISYQKDGKSQTKVPLSGIRTWGTVAGMQILEEGLTSRTAIPEQGQTARAGIEAGVEKARIAGDVKRSTFLIPPGFKTAR